MHLLSTGHPGHGAPLQLHGPPPPLTECTVSIYLSIYLSIGLQVTQIMVPLLKFYFNEDVRASAAQVNSLCAFA